MTWKFELVAGPYEGPNGGLAWDGKGMLFSVIDEGRILRFDPHNGTVEEFRRYTNRTNGIAFGPDGVLYGCQEGGRRIIQFLPDGSAVPTANQLAGRYHNFPSDLVVDRGGRVWFLDPYHGTPAFGPQIFPRSIMHRSCGLNEMSAANGSSGGSLMTRQHPARCCYPPMRARCMSPKETRDGTGRGSCAPIRSAAAALARIRSCIPSALIIRARTVASKACALTVKATSLPAVDGSAAAPARSSMSFLLLGRFWKHILYQPICRCDALLGIWIWRACT